MQKGNHEPDSDLNTLWILTRVPNQLLNYYYMKNVYYDQYIYSDDLPQKSSRRAILSDQQEWMHDHDEKYMWHFVLQENGMYQIWNALFDER